MTIGSGISLVDLVDALLQATGGYLEIEFFDGLSVVPVRFSTDGRYVIAAICLEAMRQRHFEDAFEFCKAFRQDTKKICCENFPLRLEPEDVLEFVTGDGEHTMHDIEFYFPLS